MQAYVNGKRKLLNKQDMLWAALGHTQDPGRTRTILTSPARPGQSRPGQARLGSRSENKTFVMQSLWCCPWAYSECRMQRNDLPMTASFCPKQAEGKVLYLLLLLLLPPSRHPPESISALVKWVKLTNLATHTYVHIWNIIRVLETYWLFRRKSLFFTIPER